MGEVESYQAVGNGTERLLHPKQCAWELPKIRRINRQHPDLLRCLGEMGLSETVRGGL